MHRILTGMSMMTLMGETSRRAVSSARTRAHDPRRQLAALGPVEQLRAGRLPRRLVQLAVGLWLYGASIALMVRGVLGNMPWDVLHQGIALSLIHI